MSDSQARCVRSQDYSRAQVADLRQHVEKHKYYRSEDAGRDIGEAAAWDDFAEHHLPRVAAEFREDYCTRRCEGRHACTVPARVVALNRAWAEKEAERRAAQPARDLGVCLPKTVVTPAAPPAQPAPSAPAAQEQAQPLAADT